MGWARAAVLYENDSYGRGLASAFRTGYRGEIVAFDPYDRATEDFEPYLAVFRARGAEVVFVAGAEDSGLRLLRAARALRFPAQLMGGDGWLGVTTDTAASEGAYVAAVFSPDGADERARGFVERYRARFGGEPDASAALAYDAVQAVGRALAAGATTRAEVRRELTRITGDAPLRGVTGAIAFRADGDRAGSALVLGRVHDGALPVVWREGDGAGETRESGTSGAR
jgi:branched-chain amino acid transport system substrate-binding protein